MINPPNGSVEMSSSYWFLESHLYKVGKCGEIFKRSQVGSAQSHRLQVVKLEISEVNLAHTLDSIQVQLMKLQQTSILLIII